MRICALTALLLSTAQVAATSAACAEPRAGSAVDIARWSEVRTWEGPAVHFTGGTVLMPVDLKARGGPWEVVASSGGDSVNFGLEWEESRGPRRVTVVYADVASLPAEDAQEMQVWVNGERQPIEGADSPLQGVWKTLTAQDGYTATQSGLTWTYSLPQIRAGIYKFRIVLKRKSRVRVRSIAAESDARWRKCEFETRFDPPRGNARNNVEGLNAEVLSVEPIEGCDGFRVQALASDAPPDSADRAIFTIRAGDRSFSFASSDLEADGVIRVKSLGATVSKPGVQPPATNERTITERVLEMPEQTFDRALSEVPVKKRYKFLSLSPPLNARKWAVKPDGSIFSRDEWDTVYQTATGDAPDFESREPQHVEDDYFPVLYSEWQEGGLQWQQSYVSTALGGRFDDPTSNTVIITRITATNSGEAPRAAKLWLCLRGGDGKCQNVRVDGAALYEGDRLRAMLNLGAWALASDDSPLLFATTVPPGAARSFELEIPFERTHSPFALTGFDNARKQTVDYWNARLTQGIDIVVPDRRVNAIWKSLLIHQYCWGEYDPKAGIYRPNVAAWSYGPVGNESSQMAKALDYYGHHKMAERYYEGMWRNQGADSLPARATSGWGALPGWWGNYVFNTGFITWNMVNHFRLTDDRAWLNGVVPTAIKACDWVAEQRRTTVGVDAEGHPLMECGFFPPCSLEDEGSWFYWAMTNGYLYQGMRSVADALTQIHHPDAPRITAEADAYLADLRRGIGESIVRCPVVRLRDGSYVPYVPKQLYRRGRSEGFYEAELGGLHLLTTDVYAPDSREMDWVLQFLEDVVFMTEAPSHDSILSLKNMERDWFSLGGYGKTQPYLAHQQIAYLRRDQPKLFLRSFWNQLVAQNYPDINAFPEHICWGGAADCKTYEEAMWLQQFRCMLVFEDGDRLRLAAAVPREWMQDGKTIMVKSAPTFFGPVSYTIESHADEGKIAAHVVLERGHPGKLQIRFRHPSQKPMKSVVVNGKPWQQFDPTGETIDLPGGSGPFDVEARY